MDLIHLLIVKFDDIALLSDQIQEKVAQIEFMAARGEVSEAFDQLGLLEPDYYEKERKEVLKVSCFYSQKILR